MTKTEIEVAVMDGATLIQRWPCTRTTMPDGRDGVLWRGVAYPLLLGDRVDVGAASNPECRLNHVVIPGEEASWVLIQGLPGALDAAKISLQRGGISVSRSGRWLGDPVGAVAFDWFLRCVGQLDPGEVSALLGPQVSDAAGNSPARQAILEQRISDLLAELSLVKTALQRSVAAAAQGSGDLPASDLEAALAEAHALIESLQASLAAEKSAQPAAAPSPQKPRTHEDIQSLLTTLRPNLVLLRDSLQIALGEFQSRAGVWRAINELPAAGSRPEGWKMLRGAERWWERHVSTGRNDHGRAYARFNTSNRTWHMLLGWKVEQTQDIAWLQKQD